MASTTSAGTGLQNGAPIDVLCGYCERLLSSECVQVQEAREFGSSYYFPLREKLPGGQSVSLPNFDRLWPTSKILDLWHLRELCGPTVRFWVHGTEEELRLRMHGCHLCRLVIACLDRKTLQKPLETPGPSANTRYAVPFFWEREEPRLSKGATLHLFWLEVGQQGCGQTYVDCKLGLESLPSKGQDQTKCGSRSMGALSPSTLARLRSWIEECKTGHTKCTPSILAKELPTRLLHVGKSDGQFLLKLIETRALPLEDREALKYAALSHCWGPTGPCLRLLENNYTELLSSIPFSSLPQTFKDAVVMTEALGLDYLWIDAMCIIQDKNNPDWYQEAPLMQLVYSQAEVTLAASAALDGTGGLFLQDYSLTPCKVLPQFPNIEGFQGCWFVCDDFYTAYQRDIDNAPLNQRAWVLQERMLSPRTVHFTQSQLFWECLTHVHNERNLDFLNAVGSTPRFLSVQTPWHEIVETYSRMKLTVPGDKLVAIGGVAEAYGMRHGLSPDDYLAGTWRSDPVQLLWAARQQPDPSEQVNTGGSAIAPSWSWAACPGAVHYPHFVFRSIGDEHFEYRHHFRIRDSALQLLGPSRFGSVGDGVLRVETNIWAFTGFSQTLFHLHGSNGTSISVASEVHESITTMGFSWDPLATSAYFLPWITTFMHNEAEELFGLQVRPCEGRNGAFSRVGLGYLQFFDIEELSTFCSHAGSVNLDESLYVEKLEGGGYVIDLV